MRTISTLFVLILGLLFLAPQVATAQPTDPTAAPLALPPLTPPPTEPAAAEPAPNIVATGSTSASGDRSYLLGIGDTVGVEVLGRSEFNTKARIGADGAIVLPLLGAVQAVNRSPGQLAEEIRTALEKGGYYSQPAVRVDVIGVASRYVTVLGSVGTPGLMSLDRPYHLSEIVARAGGRSSTGADYVMLTRGSAPSQKFKIAELATGSADNDPLVTTGDRIYIPAAEAEVFYINGAVKGPGAFPLSADLTVRMALARAGGVSDTGSDSKISINRKGKQLKGIKPDEMKVEAGDIITVGEKLF